MELRLYLSLLMKWVWMILLATGLAAGANYVATSMQPKLYQASVKLMVGQSIISTSPNAQDIQTSQQLAQTYIHLATTMPVLQNVVNTLNLNLPPESLKESITASVIPDTQLIQVRVNDTQPARAQALANEIARQLTLQGPGTQQDPKQREFVQLQVNDLQNKIADGQKTLNDLRSSIQVTSSAREIAAKQAQITTLETQMSQWQQSYSTLLSFLAPRSPGYLTIVEPAEMPQRPFAPNVLLSTVLAAGVGFILSLGIALVVEYLDDTIKSTDDVTHLLELPTLCSLVKITNAMEHASQKSRKRAARPPKNSGSTNHPSASYSSVTTCEPCSHSTKLVTLSSPHSVASEAYRVLRTSIQLETIDKPFKSILVTSSMRGEGKSLTAANLAITMAQGGKRTILIDGDLRRPFLHRLFKFSTNDAGLTTGLVDPDHLGTIMHATDEKNLRVITSGPLPADPSSLLGSLRMRALKERLEADADILIFDSPPCSPVADTALLAQLVDRIVLVIDVSHTRRRDALRAKEILTRTNAQILGIVLNRVHPGNLDYYYYHNYESTDNKFGVNTDREGNRLVNWLRNVGL
jgi:non-specific protein-tyrosine kinase